MKTSRVLTSGRWSLLATPFVRRAFARFHTPIALLIALLQRTPAERIVAFAREYAASPAGGNLIRPALALAGSLGAMHSLAGATTLVATASSPVSTTVGSDVQIGFTVSNTINIGSWKITGNLPPGVMLTAREGGNMLDGPGTLDATTPGVSDGYGGTFGGNTTTTPLLTGKPTQAGTYTFSLQAFEFGALGGLASSTFNFTIAVGAATSVGTAPTFKTQPQTLSAAAGNSVTLTSAADGSPAPTFQWQKNGTAISGATNASLTLNNVQVSDAGDYRVVASNSAGSATSSVATLSVSSAVTSSAPAFLRQPATLTVAAGTSAVFSADVNGATALQWRKNSTAITGATNATLVLSNAAAADAGTYSLVATNAIGTTTSSTANLVVSNAGPNDVGRLVNMAIRTNAGSGAQTLIVGFAVGGAGTSGSKPLLVRAVGPTLTQFGVGGALADPIATVYQGNTVIASNDNWSGDSQVSARANGVGAFPLAANSSLDAALALSPAAGGYTMQISGQGGSTGIALAEIYDATPGGTATSSTPRLVNVSARAQVGTGGDVLIAGFYVGGTTARTVLIRAIGPTLTGFGVGGALADPKLQLFSGSTVVQENDNWGGDAQLTNVGNSVGAFALSDANSKDAMMLVTLPPGLYSAQISGVGNTTGVALVELYEIP